MSCPNNTKPNVGGLCLVCPQCRGLKCKLPLIYLAKAFIVKNNDDPFGVLPQDIHEYLLSLGFIMESKGYYVAKFPDRKHDKYVLTVSRHNAVSRMEVISEFKNEEGKHITTLFRYYAAKKLEDVKLLVGENLDFNREATFYKELEANQTKESVS